MYTRYGSTTCLLIALLSVLLSISGSALASVSEGQALYDSGDLEGARAEFESAFEAGPDKARAAFMLGRVFQDANDLKPAVKWFEKAVKLAPDVSEYHQRLGEALGQFISEASMLTKMRKAGRVRKSFERAVELDPDNLEAHRGLIVYYLRAPGVAGGGRDKAEAAARELAKRDAIQGHRAWADIYLNYEEDENALGEIDAILAAKPDDENALLVRGVVLSRMGEYGRALEHYRNWLEHSPDEMSALYQLGRVSAISGDSPAEGAAALRRYVRHQPTAGEPKLAWGHLRLGQNYLHMGDRDQAEAEYRNALKLEPDHKQARAALRDLNKAP